MNAHKEAVTDPKALKSIMQSLQRLIKIGIYYPSGHSVLDRATEQFRHNLVKIAGNKPFIRFTVKKDTLYLQDIALDEAHFFVHEFMQTLASLSIKSLDIDREISTSEIHSFIRSLLACRTKFKSTKQFVQMNLEKLPFSVRISQAEYLSTETQPESTDETSSGSQQTFETFLESLNQQGLTSEQMNQCRKLLEAASSSSLLSQNKSKISPLITWSDVERLILSMVKKSYSTGSGESTYFQRDINALASILTTLEKSTKDKKSLEAINLLVSLVKKNSLEPEGSAEKPTGKKDKGKEKFSDEGVSNIEHFITENQVHAILLKLLFQSDRREILTIAMQLLKEKHSLNVQVRIQQIIRDILTTPLEDDEWQIISKGVHQLFEKADSEHLPVALMMIIDPLRRSQYGSSLVLFEQISRNCNTVELKKFLPFLMNEILIVGGKDNPETLHELCNIALFLSSSDFIEAIPVLKKLDAFVEEKIALNLFYSMSSANYSLFSPLLKTTLGELLAKRIIQGFTNKPPDQIIEALLPLLDSKQPLHRKFLLEYLNNTRFSTPTKTIKTLAGQIIVQTLPEISGEKRKDLALVKTIKAMSQLDGTDIRTVLKTIAYKKQLLIIPEWPTHCRQAAREALSVFQRKKKSVR